MKCHKKQIFSLQANRKKVMGRSITVSSYPLFTSLACISYVQFFFFFFQSLKTLTILFSCGFCHFVAFKLSSAKSIVFISSVNEFVFFLLIFNNIFITLFIFLFVAKYLLFPFTPSKIYPRRNVKCFSNNGKYFVRQKQKSINSQQIYFIYDK